MLYYSISSLLIAMLMLVCAKHHEHGGISQMLLSPVRTVQDMIRLRDQQEVWLNIFIHGSFGSALGFLSLPRVLDDNVRGSFYREANKRVRDDDFFYKDQPILQRGLVRLEPSFDRAVANEKFYAAYPLLEAYRIIEGWVEAEMVKKNKHRRDINFFYTFGWSGLLSQNSRRFEAIRLYNALAKEIASYRARGIDPKIRILTHSHGGNLSLNLAAIHYILNAKTLSFDDDPFGVHDARDSISAMFNLMKNLPAEELAINNSGQKRWDYVPTDKNLRIEQLLMFGSPIQPETASFCYSPMLGRIFNFYSGEDIIQRIDWVTTKRYFSDQRIRTEFFGEQLWSDIVKKVCQARIMINRDLHDQPVADHPQQTVWEILFSGNKVLTRKTSDPTHRELWYATWKKEDTEGNLLAPLPIFVVAPLFLVLIEKMGRDLDVDLNIQCIDNDLVVNIMRHGTTAIVHTIKMPRALFDELKSKLGLWRPDDHVLSEEFDAVYKHIV